MARTMARLALVAALAAPVAAQSPRAELTGFWIHVDADLLDPQVMPAVDSPEPGGPGFGELAAFLAPLIDHPRALGMQLTLYHPRLDPDGTAGMRLVAMLEGLLGRRAAGGDR